MLKTITKALLCLVISSNAFAGHDNDMAKYLAEAKKYHAFDNVLSALSVVEVLATGKGSGVIVLKDDKLVIVTNSHNLQGKKSALITLPERYINNYFNEKYTANNGNLSFHGTAEVLYDFPLSDVAILAFPEDQLSAAERKVILKYAMANGNLSSKDGWVPGISESFANDSITAVLQGKSTLIEGSRKFNGTQIKDTFISGDESLIWAAPIYSKPGVSGGAYYRRGVLTGLVTKISLSGEPMTLSTPFTKIAKLLYSPHSNEKQIFWKDGLMVYKSSDKLITINPLGNGWLGNGGMLEEIDESSSGDSNPNYWRFELQGSYYTKEIATWDPFVFRPGHFFIDKENVSFVKTKNKSLFKTTETYSIPTLAQYIASENNKEEQTFLQNTPLNLKALKEARLNQKTNINRGRVYGVSKYSKLFKNETPEGKGESFITKSSARSQDREGYLYNEYESFGTRFSDKTIFDVKIRPEVTGYSKQIAITADSDLSQVIIKKINVDYSSKTVEAEILLRPQEINSPQSLIFKSDDGKHKAILMYSNTDLTKLVRVFVISENVLVEFWTEMSLFDIFKGKN